MHRVAWLSLDEGDNDPTRFLTYVVAALSQGQESESTFGNGARSMLQSPRPPSTEVILTSLINETAAIDGRLILVLDDYHLIEAQPIHDALAFLLDHLPPRMHLVISTREDPHLPLARLRARAQLTELRAADLRFSSSEAAEFLNQAMGLDLSAGDIAALVVGSVAGVLTARILLLASGGVRLVTTGLLTFGSGGAAGGAVCGLILWLLTRSTVALIVSAVVGGYMGCICVGIAMLLYGWTPWPGPKVYPGPRPLFRWPLRVRGGRAGHPHTPSRSHHTRSDSTTRTRWSATASANGTSSPWRTAKST